MKPIRLQVVHSLALRTCAAFVALFILSVPFPYQLLPDPGSLFSPFFEILVRFTGNTFLGIHHPYTSRLISDSTGLFIHSLNLVFISLAIAGVSLLTKLRDEAIRYWIQIISRYYLALQLLIYGFSKILKAQFYLPEPNNLFTPLGDIPQDLLYWSTMGSSHLYTVFGGIAEVIAATLLLLRRTSRLGAYVSAAVLLNVVMINLSYNISVKLYSLFLLILSLFILLLLRNASSYAPNISRSRMWFAKSAAILLLLADSSYIYISAGRYNDDNVPRPPLHGAYDVITFKDGDSVLQPLLTDTSRWRRVFVHRRGYFIVQLMNDRMKDYELHYDTARKHLVIIDPRSASRSILAYNKTADSTLRLAGTIGGHSLNLKLQQIDLSQLPLLKREFNWTIDQE